MGGFAYEFLWVFNGCDVRLGMLKVPEVGLWLPELHALRNETGQEV